jgi:thioredoxin-like negative regulator of GroEL
VQDAEEAGKNIAVFFHEKNCGSCAKLDGDITANAKNIPSDTVILKADWDDNQALARQLKVDKYHTVAFINADGTSDNVKGLFTLDDLVDAGAEVVEKTISSNYELYTEDAVLKAEKEGKDVAVFFHSKSCGSCATLDADIVANASDIDSDVVILKADWDENQDLAAQYGVTGYHTVAYMNDDDSTTNVKGLFTLNDVLSNF